MASIEYVILRNAKYTAMLFLLIALNTANGAIGTTRWSEVEARLNAYASRFTDVSIPYFVEGRKYTYWSSSGNESLSDGEGFPISSYIDGVLDVVTSEEKVARRRVVQLYGSRVKSQISDRLADIQLVSNTLTASISGVPLLESVDKGYGLKWSTIGDSTSLSFVPPRSSAHRVDIDFVGNSDLIGKVKIEYPSTSVERTYKYSADTFPVTISELVKWKSGRETNRTYVVGAPKPIIKEIPAVRYRIGDDVSDLTLGISYAWRPEIGFDLGKAQAALNSARLGVELSGLKSRPLMCGPDCLYYLLQLMGKPANCSQILSQFPLVAKQGSSFLELQTVASHLGVGLEGYQCTLDQLHDLKRPAILSMRPSHYQLLIPDSSRWVLIDPPYSVKILSTQQMKVLFSGDVLVPKD